MDEQRDPAGVEEGEEAAKVGERVEWALVRAAYAHPKAFQSSVVTAAYFDDKVLASAWRTILRLAKDMLPDKACDRGAFLQEVVAAGNAPPELLNIRGEHWLNKLIGGATPPDVRYATAKLAGYLHKRYQVRLWKGRHGTLAERVDATSDVDTLFRDWVLDAKEVSRFDYASTEDFSVAEAMRFMPGSDRVIPTGYEEIDMRTGGGLAGGNMFIVGGGTNDGKSMWALATSRRRAKLGRTTFYISMEDDRDLLRCRMLSSFCGLAPERIRIRSSSDLPTIEQAERDAVSALTGKWYRAIARRSTVSSVCEIMRIATYACGADTVIVDYLQAIQPDDPEESNKARIVADAIDALKACAAECNVLLVLTSQYNREGYGDGAEPNLYDFKWAGEAENAADAAVCLWRDPEDASPRLLHAKIVKLKWANVDVVPRYVIARESTTGWHQEWEIDHGSGAAQEQERQKGSKTRNKRR